MKREIDARGLACPAPVVNTKKALQDPEVTVLEVLVDGEVARDNVKRFAQKQGCLVEVAAEGEAFRLRVTRSEAPAAETGTPCAPTACAPSVVRPVLYVTSDLMGHGDEALGKVLIRAFLKTLADADVKPTHALFVNRAIFLTTEGSEVLEAIRTLEEQGVEIHSCGTCLDYYERKEMVRVGAVSDMFAIVDVLTRAGKVITP